MNKTSREGTKEGVSGRQARADGCALLCYSVLLLLLLLLL
jgi:hypothetical protein